MEDKAEPESPGISTSWFYRVLVPVFVLAMVFAALTQRWWVVTIALVVVVAIVSGVCVVRTHRDVRRAEPL